MCKGRGEGWRGEADTGVVGGAWQAGFLADSGEWQVEKKLRKQVAKNQRMLADIFWRSAARRKWVMSSVKSLTRKKIEENSLSAVHHSRLTDNLLSRGWQAIYIQQVVDYMMSNKDIDNSRGRGGGCQEKCDGCIWTDAENCFLITFPWPWWQTLWSQRGKYVKQNL